MITATRNNLVRQTDEGKLENENLMYYLMDSGESFTVLGRVPFSPEPLPGRAIIKKEESYFSQKYVCQLMVRVIMNYLNQSETMSCLYKKNMRAIKTEADSYASNGINYA